MITYYQIFEIVFPATYAISAIILIFLSTWGLLKRCPIIFPSRLVFTCFLLFFIPIFLHAVNQLTVGPSTTSSSIILNTFAIIVIPVLLGFIWCYTGGYTIIGLKKSAIISQYKDILDQGGDSLALIQIPLIRQFLLTARGPAKTPLHISIIPELRKRFTMDHPPFHPTSFLLPMTLGLIIASLGIISWCYATQCIPS